MPFLNRISYLTLFVLLVLLTTWWIDSLEIQPKIQAENQHDQPDYWIEHVNLTQFDATGNIQHRVSTPYLVHFPKQDAAYLQQPTLWFFNHHESEPWQLNSIRGAAFNNGERIELNEAVKLHQNAAPNRQQTDLLTEALTIYPQRKLVTSQRTVTILQPGLTIRSIGLKADFNKGQIELLSQTQGHYETHS